jgi:hypothetical protein
MDKHKQGKKSFAKGRGYEYRKAEELTKYFGDLCGAQFIRRGGQEKQKWAWRGDVVCKKKYICGTDCILSEAFWEMKFRKNPQAMACFKKAKDDAEGHEPIVIVNDGEVEVAMVNPKFIYSLLYEVVENRINL